MTLQDKIHQRIREKQMMAEATSEHGFWKDPRTIFGLILTAVFSALFAAGLWIVGEASYARGIRDVHIEACERACGVRDTSMSAISLINQAYRCYCLNGNELTPIPGHLYSERPRYEIMSLEVSTDTPDAGQ